MKKVMLLAIMGVFSSYLFSQVDTTSFFQFKDNYYTASNIEIVPGFSKDELFKNALLWISKQYNANQVKIQTKDSENSLIVLNGFSKSNSTARHKLTLQFKDGRYKWEISEIYFYLGISSMPQLNRSAEVRFKNELGSESSLVIIYRNFKELIQNMEKNMIIKVNW